MANTEQTEWLRKLGVNPSSFPASDGAKTPNTPPKGAEARPGGGGDVKGLFSDLKKKFKPVKDTVEEIKEIYDDLNEMKEKFDEAKETYDDLSELFEEAKTAKEKCDNGDEEGIKAARDLLAHALEKAQKLDLPPGAKELLEVYQGAVLSTKVAEGKDYRSQIFKQYLQDAESKGDPKAVVENARQELSESMSMNESEFDKKLAEYMREHPDGKVAKACGKPVAERAPQPESIPAKPAARPNDEDLNVQIIEAKVKPLKDKWDTARKEAQDAQRRAENAVVAAANAKEHSGDPSANERKAAADLNLAKKVLERAKARAEAPRNPNPDEIVLLPSSAKAQASVAAAEKQLELAKSETAAKTGAVDQANAWAKETKEALLTAQSAASGAEDAYQRERLRWYTRARLATPKLVLPEDLQRWKDRHPAAP